MSQVEATISLPPGPRLSVEETLKRFNEDPFRYLETLENTYGTIFTLELGTLGNEPIAGVPNNGKWVFLTRPHQIKIMYEAAGSMASGALANKVFFGTTEASVGYIEGAAHKRRRAQLHPVFNGSRDHTALVQQVAARCIARWPRNEPFPLFLELQKLTSELIVEIVCGAMETRDRAHLCAMMPRTENACYTHDEVREADVAIRSFIQQRIGGYLEKAQKVGREDTFAMLLRLADMGDESLSPEVIRDEVFSLLYTGFSTTSTVLSWAFRYILAHEAVHRNLLQELREVVGDEPLSQKHLGRLVYLDATVKETLRLNPVTPLNGVRLLKQPLEIDGCLMPAGTILVHCAYLLQRSSDVYPESARFMPERFLGKRVDPYAWGAFGGGERICIGRGLALMEIKTLLAKMLSELSLELVGGMPRAKMQGFFMAPEDGTPIILRSREGAERMGRSSE